MPKNVNLNNPLTDEVRNPAAYRLNHVILENHYGRKKDIIGMVSHFRITESVYTSYLDLSLYLFDNWNFFEEFLLSGQEKITLDISLTEPLRDKGPKTHKIQIEFLVAEYPAFGKLPQRKQAYVIRAVSEHAYLLKFLRLSEYIGIKKGQKNIKEIISYICESYLNIEIEDVSDDSYSIGKINGIIPNLTPLDAINWLLRRAWSNNGSPWYLYQTLRDSKMHLVCHDDLIDRGPKPQTYYESNLFTSEETENSEYEYNSEGGGAFERILSLESNVKSSKFSAGIEGSWAAKTQYLDIGTKKFSEETFDYLKEFSNKTILNKYPILSNQWKINDKLLNEYFDSNRNYISLNSLAYDNKPNYHTVTEENTISKNISYSETGEAIVHDIRIHGDPSIQSGDILKLQFATAIEGGADPGPGSYTSHIINRDPVFDYWLSGNYIITGIEHVFDDNYFLDLRLKKDSYTEPGLDVNKFENGQ